MTVAAHYSLLLLILVLGVLVRAHRPTRPVAPPPDTLLTEQQDDLTQAERQKMTRHLLGMLGLKQRPLGSDRVTTPPYMLELYRQHVTASRGQRTHRAHAGYRPVFSASTIKSFLHKEEVDEVETSRNNERDSRFSDQVNKLNNAVFYYNLTGVSKDDALKGAELRIYRHGVANSSTSNSSQGVETDIDDSSASSGSERQRIEIYEVVRPARDGFEAIWRLLDTRTVWSHLTAWEAFDITSAVVRWIAKPESNYGIKVQVRTDGSALPGLKHVRLKRDTSVHVRDESWHSERPLLVTYSGDGVSHSRQRRRTRRARKRKKGSRKMKNHCKRRQLYVDFRNVGWDDWIVAPPGYQAYHCDGECPYVIGNNLNATNHAIVQGLVNSVDPTQAPKPCCVPTQLSAISMLYVDEMGRTTLKNYQDMVVEGCGCR